MKRCNLCGCKKWSFLFEKDDFKIWRCDRCSLLFVNPQPSVKDLKDFYSNRMFKRGKKYDYSLKGRSLEYSEKNNDMIKLKFMNDYVDSGKLLDVGCAKGFFLYLIKDRFDVMGVEYSRSAAKVAKKLGLDVIEGEISDVKKKGFDTITMWDVIEHVNDPTAVLRNANSKMKKGGHLFLSTGDSSRIIPKISLKKWHLMTPPMHLYFFSKRTLRLILKKCGFQLLDVRYYGKKMELGWIIFKLGDSRKNKVLLWLYKKIDKTWIANLKLRVNTFDIMTLRAKKVKDI